MQCLIYDQDYLLRILIGYDENQRHIISCNACKNDLTVELKKDIFKNSLNWNKYKVLYTFLFNFYKKI